MVSYEEICREVRERNRRVFWLNTVFVAFVMLIGYAFAGWALLGPSFFIGLIILRLLDPEE